jgi:hypothetical protein
MTKSSNLSRSLPDFRRLACWPRLQLCLTGPAKVVDGDTIVVAGQLPAQHRRPRTGRQSGRAGSARAPGRQGLLSQGSRHRPQVGVGGVVASRRYSMDYIAAEDEARKARLGMCRGTFVKLCVARNSTAAAPTAIHAVGSGLHDGSRLDRDLQSIANGVGAGRRACGTRSGRCRAQHPGPVA